MTIYYLIPIVTISGNKIALLYGGGIWATESDKRGGENPNKAFHSAAGAARSHQSAAVIDDGECGAP